MRPSYSLIWFGLGLAAALAGPAPDRNGGQIRLGYQEQEFPEMGKQTTGLLAAGGQWYRFMPLPGWAAATDAEQRALSLRSPDNVRIRVRFPAGQDAPQPPYSAEALRGYVAAAYPGAQIVAEATAHASCAAGPLVEFRWRTAAGVGFVWRIAWVEMNHQLVEFSLTSGAELHETHRNSFAAFLTSFQPAGADE